MNTVSYYIMISMGNNPHILSKIKVVCLLDTRMHTDFKAVDVSIISEDNQENH